MYTGDEYCHSSSIEVNVDTDTAFKYLSDGVAQGDWTLGSMQRKKVRDNTYSGVSLFNGDELFIQIEADLEKLIIYYHVGMDLENLQPRNVVRIVPGPVIGRDETVCLITLLSWRNAAADDAKWKLTCVSHETEMYIIKNRLESQI
ncbi:MAG: hypothetical protein GKR93_06590 [Gammaproteobacteria bacterium]|nr:hypothetical protein [Gammaproteobacteria bacterium]